MAQCHTPEDPNPHPAFHWPETKLMFQLHTSLNQANLTPLLLSDITS